MLRKVILSLTIACTLSTVSLWGIATIGDVPSFVYAAGCSASCCNGQSSCSGSGTCVCSCDCSSCNCRFKKKGLIGTIIDIIK